MAASTDSGRNVGDTGRRGRDDGRLGVDRGTAVIGTVGSGVA